MLLVDKGGYILPCAYNKDTVPGTGERDSCRPWDGIGSSVLSINDNAAGIVVGPLHNSLFQHLKKWYLFESEIIEEQTQTRGPGGSQNGQDSDKDDTA